MKINCQRRKQDHTLLLLAGLDSVSLRVGVAVGVQELFGIAAGTQ